MTETPKKAVRKKAAPKAAGPKAEPKKTKARTMTDQEMRETVLAKALPQAWSNSIPPAPMRRWKSG